MTSTIAGRTAELSAHESRFLFERFDHTTAWDLGVLMVEQARARAAAIIIDIRRPGLVLFRSAQAGVSANNEDWLDRKARTALHYETSTALIATQFEEQNIDPDVAPWFDSAAFAAAGGSFPLRVKGVGVIAAVTVSGLPSDDDHHFIIECLDIFAERTAAADGV